MMYDDIVASTQPLNYNPALFLQKFNYGSGGYYSSMPGFFNEEEDDASVIENSEYEHFGVDDIPSQHNEDPFVANEDENYHLVSCGDGGQPTCSGISRTDKFDLWGEPAAS